MYIVEIATYSPVIVVFIENYVYKREKRAATLIVPSWATHPPSHHKIYCNFMRHEKKSNNNEEKKKIIEF